RHTRFSRDWSSDVCSSDLLLHELLCRQATQPLIKLQTDHYVDTLFLECDQLLTKSRQPWWRLIPSKVFPGLRLKHHHHRRHFQDIGRASCRESGQTSGAAV